MPKEMVQLLATYLASHKQEHLGSLIHCNRQYNQPVLYLNLRDFNPFFYYTVLKMLDFIHSLFCPSLDFQMTDHIINLLICVLRKEQNGKD